MLAKRQWLKTIRGQLIFGFGVIVLLNFISALIGYGTLQHLRHRTQKTLDQAARVREVSLQLKINFLLARKAEKIVLDDWQLTKLSQEFKDSIDSNQKYIDQARHNLATIRTLEKKNPELKDELSLLQSLFDNYESAFQGTVNRITQDETGYQLHQRLHEIMKKLMTEEISLKNTSLRIPLGKLISEQEKYFLLEQQNSPNDLRSSFEQLQYVLEDLKADQTNDQIKVLVDEYLSTINALFLLDQQVKVNQIVADNINQEIDRIIEVITDKSKVKAEQAQLELTRTANYSSAALLVTAITALALIFWVSLRLGKLIVQPLTKLTEASERISRGILHERLNLSANNEFGVVAAALNKMLNQLAETLTNLEKMVAERTQRLQAKTQSLEITLKKLRSSEAKYQQLINNLHAGVIVYGPDGNMMMGNSAAWKLLGVSSDNFSLIPPSEIFWTFVDESGTVLPPEKHPSQQVITSSVPLQNYVMGIVRQKPKNSIWTLVNAFPTFDEKHHLSQVVVVILDITDRKLAEEKLRYRALHDALTGLPNRTLLTERLDHAIQRAKRHPESLFALLFIDLDRFKVINDSLGHLVGDRLLIHIANTLKRHVRSSDMVARLGGDEFVILLEDIASPQQVIQVIERIQVDIKKPINLMNKTLFTSASIGIALSSPEYTSGEDILRDADNAMYRAKANKLSNYEIFNLEMRQTAMEIFELETSLQHALEQQNFLLHYQPIVSSTSLELLGFEALVRWDHPERGIISPRDFIPLAEDTGLIIPLSEWIFQEACRQMADWCTHFPIVSSLKMSVNIAPFHFQNPKFLEKLDQILAQTNLAAKNLKLELTERLLLENTDKVMSIIPQLQKRQIEISLDDFGTGYSSLNYLKRFPFNTIKIDKSFVDGLDYDNVDTSIIEAIIHIAQSLGMDVVAEGVETNFQRELLQQLGCEAIQGYLVAPSLTAKEAEVFINRQLFSIN